MERGVSKAAAISPGSNHSPAVRRAVIIPGARKAGTSSLHAALAAHPGVVAGRYKETQFFALDEGTVEANIQWYLGLFGDRRETDTRTIVDASTFYLMSERAPTLIRRHVADPRVVIVLRDPAERAFAGYEYLRQRLPSPEGRTFEDIVQALERAGPIDVSRAEDEALAIAVRDHRVPARYYTESFHEEHYGAPFETRLEDPLNILRYFGESRYSEHVIRWQRVLPGSVHLVAFERLIAEPSAVLSEIQEFCGLDPVPALTELPRENPTRVARGGMSRWILGRAVRRAPGGLIDGAVRLVRALGIGGVLRTKVLETRRQQLDPDLRSRCRALLDAEYAWWREHDPSIAAWWD